ncbi:hypothetical protein PSM36_2212 [Proteiniphilum saccharofermentans]|uniref:Uncharacterized protein n=2 Tax=Proteiniphilum saccharofermentans TaxID=1642647 RepID=A0A1R3T8V6_9BACT|nr:hypothetical protein PSM36_2212 [Proteiniphilum saccharofermentans]
MTSVYFVMKDFDVVTSPWNNQEIAATQLKNLGFDGIEHRETEGILEMKVVLEKEGLKLYADYMRIDIDQKYVNCK